MCKVSEIYNDSRKRCKIEKNEEFLMKWLINFCES